MDENLEILDVDLENTNSQVENVESVDTNKSVESEIPNNDVETIEYDEVDIPITEDDLRFDSHFEGRLLEYLGYKMLNMILTAITFGFAKPWADVIFYEYKYSHTIYDGKRLKFVGKGAELYVESFKWTFFTIITFGIYGLWVPLKKERWVVSHICFEDEEFTKGESFFTGKLLGLIGVNLLTIFLSLLSFGLLLPFCICYRQRWFKKNTIIHRKRIIFHGKALNLLGKYLLWILLTFVTLGIYGLWVPIKFINWEVSNTNLKLKNEYY